MAFNQFRRKCIAYAATCCGAAVGIHACSLSPNPQQREEDGKQGISSSADKWAFPHPYGNDTETNRFVDAQQFRLKKTVWNLKGIVDRWSVKTMMKHGHGCGVFITNGLTTFLLESMSPLTTR